MSHFVTSLVSFKPDWFHVKATILRLWIDNFTSKAFAYSETMTIADLHKQMVEKMALKPEEGSQWAIYEKKIDGGETVCREGWQVTFSELTKR